MKGSCTSCGYTGRLYYADPAHKICEGCLTRFVIKTKRAVMKSRPTRKEVRGDLETLKVSIEQALGIVMGHVTHLQDRVKLLEAKSEITPAKPVTKSGVARRLLEAEPNLTRWRSNVELV